MVGVYPTSDAMRSWSWTTSTVGSSSPWSLPTAAPGDALESELGLNSRRMRDRCPEANARATSGTRRVSANITLGCIAPTQTAERETPLSDGPFCPVFPV
jgi:hypothetical protein